ncbi:unnamed protein product [Gordionus sp. m RMFG-2023]
MSVEPPIRSQTWDEGKKQINSFEERVNEFLGEKGEKLQNVESPRMDTKQFLATMKEQVKDQPNPYEKIAKDLVQSAKSGEVDFRPADPSLANIKEASVTYDTGQRNSGKGNGIKSKELDGKVGNWYTPGFQVPSYKPDNQKSFPENVDYTSPSYYSSLGSAPTTEGGDHDQNNNDNDHFQDSNKVVKSSYPGEQGIESERSYTLPVRTVKPLSSDKNIKDSSIREATLYSSRQNNPQGVSREGYNVSAQAAYHGRPPYDKNYSNNNYNHDTNKMMRNYSNGRGNNRKQMIIGSIPNKLETMDVVTRPDSSVAHYLSQEEGQGVVKATRETITFTNEEDKSPQYSLMKATIKGGSDLADSQKPKFYTATITYYHHQTENLPDNQQKLTSSSPNSQYSNNIPAIEGQQVRTGFMSQQQDPFPVDSSRKGIRVISPETIDSSAYYNAPVDAKVGVGGQLNPLGKDETHFYGSSVDSGYGRWGNLSPPLSPGTAFDDAQHHYYSDGKRIIHDQRGPLTGQIVQDSRQFSRDPRQFSQDSRDPRQFNQDSRQFSQETRQYNPVPVVGSQVGSGPRDYSPSQQGYETRGGRVSGQPSNVRLDPRDSVHLIVDNNLDTSLNIVPGTPLRTSTPIIGYDSRSNIPTGGRGYERAHPERPPPPQQYLLDSDLDRKNYQESSWRANAPAGAVTALGAGIPAAIGLNRLRDSNRNDYSGQPRDFSQERGTTYDVRPGYALTGPDVGFSGTVPDKDVHFQDNAGIFKEGSGKAATLRRKSSFKDKIQESVKDVKDKIKSIVGKDKDHYSHNAGTVIEDPNIKYPPPPLGRTDSYEKFRDEELAHVKFDSKGLPLTTGVIRGNADDNRLFSEWGVDNKVQAPNKLYTDVSRQHESHDYGTHNVHKKESLKDKISESVEDFKHKITAPFHHHEGHNIDEPLASRSSYAIPGAALVGSVVGGTGAAIGSTFHHGRDDSNFNPDLTNKGNFPIDRGPGDVSLSRNLDRPGYTSSLDDRNRFTNDAALGNADNKLYSEWDRGYTNQEFRPNQTPYDREINQSNYKNYVPGGVATGAATGAAVRQGETTKGSDQHRESMKDKVADAYHDFKEMITSPFEKKDKDGKYGDLRHPVQSNVAGVNNDNKLYSEWDKGYPEQRNVSYEGPEQSNYRPGSEYDARHPDYDTRGFDNNLKGQQPYTSNFDGPDSHHGYKIAGAGLAGSILGTGLAAGSNYHSDSPRYNPTVVDTTHPHALRSESITDKIGEGLKSAKDKIIAPFKGHHTDSNYHPQGDDVKTIDGPGYPDLRNKVKDRDGYYIDPYSGVTQEGDARRYEGDYIPNQDERTHSHLKPVTLGHKLIRKDSYEKFREEHGRDHPDYHRKQSLKDKISDSLTDMKHKIAAPFKGDDQIGKETIKVHDDKVAGGDISERYPYTAPHHDMPSAGMTGALLGGTGAAIGSSWYANRDREGDISRAADVETSKLHQAREASITDKIGEGLKDVKDKIVAPFKSHHDTGHDISHSGGYKDYPQSHDPSFKDKISGTFNDLKDKVSTTFDKDKNIDKVGGSRVYPEDNITDVKVIKRSPSLKEKFNEAFDNIENKITAPFHRDHPSHTNDLKQLSGNKVYPEGRGEIRYGENGEPISQHHKSFFEDMKDKIAAPFSHDSNVVHNEYHSDNTRLGGLTGPEYRNTSTGPSSRLDKDYNLGGAAFYGTPIPTQSLSSNFPSRLADNQTSAQSFIKDDYNSSRYITTPIGIARDRSPYGTNVEPLSDHYPERMGTSPQFHHDKYDTYGDFPLITAAKEDLTRVTDDMSSRPFESRYPETDASRRDIAIGPGNQQEVRSGVGWAAAPLAVPIGAAIYSGVRKGDRDENRSKFQDSSFRDSSYGKTMDEGRRGIADKGPHADYYLNQAGKDKDRVSDIRYTTGPGTNKSLNVYETNRQDDRIGYPDSSVNKRYDANRQVSSQDYGGKDDERRPITNKYIDEDYYRLNQGGSREPAQPSSGFSDGRPTGQSVNVYSGPDSSSDRLALIDRGRTTQPSSQYSIRDYNISNYNRSVSPPFNYGKSGNAGSFRSKSYEPRASFPHFIVVDKRGQNLPHDDMYGTDFYKEVLAGKYNDPDSAFPNLKYLPENSQGRSGWSGSLPRTSSLGSYFGGDSVGRGQSGTTYKMASSRPGEGYNQSTQGYNDTGYNRGGPGIDQIGYNDRDYYNDFSGVTPSSNIQPGKPFGANGQTKKHAGDSFNLKNWLGETFLSSDKKKAAPTNAYEGQQQFDSNNRSAYPSGGNYGYAPHPTDPQWRGNEGYYYKGGAPPVPAPPVSADFNAQNSYSTQFESNQYGHPGATFVAPEARIRDDNFSKNLLTETTIPESVSEKITTIEKKYHDSKNEYNKSALIPVLSPKDEQVVPYASPLSTVNQAPKNDLTNKRETELETQPDIAKTTTELPKGVEIKKKSSLLGKKPKKLLNRLKESFSLEREDKKNKNEEEKITKDDSSKLNKNEKPLATFKTSTSTKTDISNGLISRDNAISLGSTSPSLGREESNNQTDSYHLDSSLKHDNFRASPISETIRKKKDDDQDDYDASKTSFASTQYNQKYVPILSDQSRPLMFTSSTGKYTPAKYSDLSQSKGQVPMSVDGRYSYLDPNRKPYDDFRDKVLTDSIFAEDAVDIIAENPDKRFKVVLGPEIAEKMVDYKYLGSPYKDDQPNLSFIKGVGKSIQTAENSTGFSQKSSKPPTTNHVKWPAPSAPKDGKFSYVDQKNNRYADNRTPDLRDSKFREEVLLSKKVDDDIDDSQYDKNNLKYKGASYKLPPITIPSTEYDELNKRYTEEYKGRDPIEENFSSSIYRPCPCNGPHPHRIEDHEEEMHGREELGDGSQISLASNKDVEKNRKDDGSIKYTQDSKNEMDYEIATGHLSRNSLISDNLNLNLSETLLKKKKDKTPVKGSNKYSDSDFKNNTNSISRNNVTVLSAPDMISGSPREPTVQQIDMDIKKDKGFPTNISLEQRVGSYADKIIHDSTSEISKISSNTDKVNSHMFIDTELKRRHDPNTLTASSYSDKPDVRKDRDTTYDKLGSFSGDENVSKGAPISSTEETPSVKTSVEDKISKVKKKNSFSKFFSKKPFDKKEQDLVIDRNESDIIKSLDGYDLKQTPKQTVSSLTGRVSDQYETHVTSANFVDSPEQNQSLYNQNIPNYQQSKFDDNLRRYLSSSNQDDPKSSNISNIPTDEHKDNTNNYDNKLKENIPTSIDETLKAGSDRSKDTIDTKFDKDFITQEYGKGRAPEMDAPKRKSTNKLYKFFSPKYPSENIKESTAITKADIQTPNFSSEDISSSQNQTFLDFSSNVESTTRLDHNYLKDKVNREIFPKVSDSQISLGTEYNEKKINKEVKFQDEPGFKTVATDFKTTGDSGKAKLGDKLNQFFGPTKKNQKESPVIRETDKFLSTMTEKPVSSYQSDILSKGATPSSVSYSSQEKSAGPGKFVSGYISPKTDHVSMLLPKNEYIVNPNRFSNLRDEEGSGTKSSSQPEYSSSKDITTEKSRGLKDEDDVATKGSGPGSHANSSERASQSRSSFLFDQFGNNLDTNINAKTRTYKTRTDTGYETEENEDRHLDKSSKEAFKNVDSTAGVLGSSNTLPLSRSAQNERDEGDAGKKKKRNKKGFWLFDLFSEDTLDRKKNKYYDTEKNEGDFPISDSFNKVTKEKKKEQDETLDSKIDTIIPKRDIIHRAPKNYGSSTNDPTANIQKLNSKQDIVADGYHSDNEIISPK